MGVTYSKPYTHTTVAKELRLCDSTVLTVRSKLLGINRNFAQNNVYFVTKEQLRWAFGFDDVQIYKCFNLFYATNPMVIPSLEFWGAMVLTSTDSVEEKLSFLFKLLDFDDDDFIGHDDLFILITTACRGCAKMKGFYEIPAEKIDKFLHEAFRSYAKELSDTGELSLVDFRTFAVANDNSRTYLSRVGGLKIEAAADNAALVAKRSSLMQEVVANRVELEQLLLLIQDSEDAANERADRVGDIEMLRLTNEEKSSDHNSLTKRGMYNDLRQKHPAILGRKALVRSLEQELKSSQTGRHSISSSNLFKSKERLTDAEVFSDVRSGKPAGTSRNIYGENFKKALLSVWEKLPQDGDFMAHVNESVIVSLFGAVGVVISYSDARRCLRDLQSSQLGKHNFHEILRWHLMIGSNKAYLASSVYKEWKCFNLHLFQQINSAAQRVVYYLNCLKTERRILSQIDRLSAQQVCKYSSYFKAQNRSSASNSSTKSANQRGRQPNEADDLVRKFKEFKNATTRSRQTKPASIAAKYTFGATLLQASFDSQSNSFSEPFLPKDSRHNNSTLLDYQSLSSQSSQSVLTKQSTATSHQREESIGSDLAKPLPQSTRGREKVDKDSEQPKTPSRNRNNSTSPQKRREMREETAKFSNGLSIKLSASTNPFVPAYASKSRNLENCKILGAVSSDPEAPNFSPQGESFVIREFGALQSIELLEYYNELQEAEYQQKQQEISRQNTLREEEQQRQQHSEDQSRAFTSDFTAPDSKLVSALGSVDEASMQSKSTAFTMSAYLAPPKAYSSVVWFSVQVKEGSSEEQEMVLAQILRNYFDSIPCHIRQQLYSDVKVDTFSITYKEVKDFKQTKKDRTGQSVSQSRSFSFGPNSTAGTNIRSSVQTASDSVTNSSSNVPLNSVSRTSSADSLAAEEVKQRVVLVSLLHKEDYFKQFEHSLVMSDIFVSRALNDANFEFSLTKSFSELYKESMSFYQFEQRLYGPQENEIGEEGMNPLNFAKTTRQKKKFVQDKIKRAERMNKDELLGYCKLLGIKEIGNVSELRERVERVFSEELDLVGHGEMSNFGAYLVDCFFKVFKAESVDNAADQNKPDQYKMKSSLASIEENPGLSLWEFNKFLFHCDAPTMYDASEYKAFVQTHELNVDRDNFVRGDGLRYFYRKYGHLALDNDSVGVGSLDRSCCGKLLFNANYDSEAIASLLELMGGNTSKIPSIISLLSLVSSIKEIKLDGDMEHLSDLVRVLAEHIDLLKHMKDGLRRPGWLAANVNFLSEKLADGSSGLVHSLRRFVSESFGKYDQWEQLFTTDLSEKIRTEWDLWHDRYLQFKKPKTPEEHEFDHLIGTSMDDEAFFADFDESEKTLKEQTGADVKTNIQDDASVKDSKIAPDVEIIPSENYLGPEAEASMLEKQRRDIIQSTITDSLPSLPSHSNVNLPYETLAYKEELIFLNEIQHVHGFNLSLEESKRINDRKKLCNEKLERCGSLMKENEQLLAAHTCALYDALRLIGSGIPMCGLGSRDFNVGLSTKNFNWLELLPRGVGEFSPVKQEYLDKVERANARKAAALAALERERLRRNMTDEEKARIEAEKLAQKLQRWANEEFDLYNTAYAALMDARDTRKSVAEKEEVMRLWERLLSMKENRYPGGDIRVAIAQNNLGCVLLELFGANHPLGDGASVLFQEAVENIKCSNFLYVPPPDDNAETKVVDEKELSTQKDARLVVYDTSNENVGADTLLQLKDAIKKRLEIRRNGKDPYVEDPSLSGLHDADEDVDDDEQFDGFSSLEDSKTADAALDASLLFHSESLRLVRSAATSLNVAEIKPRMLLMLNYFTVLIESESMGQLMQSYELKLHLYYLYLDVTRVEREKLDLGLVNPLDQVEVFCYKPPRDVLGSLVREIEKSFSDEYDKLQTELHALLNTNFLSLEETLRDPMEDVKRPKTKKELRDEKRLKMQTQRRLDALERSKSTQQRKLLYELIQSDHINAIFEAKAGQGNSAVSPTFAKKRDPAMEKSVDEYMELLQSISSKKPTVAGKLGGGLQPDGSSTDTFEWDLDRNYPDPGALEQLKSSVQADNGSRSLSSLPVALTTDAAQPTAQMNRSNSADLDNLRTGRSTVSAISGITDVSRKS